MPYTFFYLAAAFALLEWAAVAFAWRKLEYVAKPGVIAALLLFIAQLSGFSLSPRLLGGGMLFIALGLACSLLGDVLLILPRERFSAGLGAFLAAHLCYIIGFNPIPPLRPMHLAAAGVLVVLMLAPALQVYRRLTHNLASSERGRLKLPLALYCAALSVMLLSAMFTLLRSEWQPVASLTVAAGAGLFALSDTLLGWNRFVAPLRNGRLIYMIAYHTGQMLITLGAAGHYLLK